jgi:hypothetical protein
MITELSLLVILAAQASPAMTPTRPEPARDSSDWLLQTVITDVLRIGHRELKEGPILIERTDPTISPRILPDNSNVTFVLLTPSEIRSASMSGRYHINLKVALRSSDEADVTVFMGPTGPGIWLCCFTVIRRYERADGAWRFVRTVSSAIH